VPTAFLICNALFEHNIVTRLSDGKVRKFSRR